MREIKFRAQQFNHGKNGFQYGSYATDNKDYHAILKEHDTDSESMLNVLINPETLGQYTGLKDKSGVEIYFDDIVYIAGYGDLHVNDIGDLVTLIDALAENDIGSILGNIHEHPELRNNK